MGWMEDLRASDNLDGREMPQPTQPTPLSPLPPPPTTTTTTTKASKLQQRKNAPPTVRPFVLCGHHLVAGHDGGALPTEAPCVLHGVHWRVCVMVRYMEGKKGVGTHPGLAARRPPRSGRRGQICIRGGDSRVCSLIKCTTLLYHPPIPQCIHLFVVAL